MSSQSTAARALKISPDILAVIDAAIVNGSSLTLIGQLDRTMYVKVAQIIELAGGKWNKKAKAHLFEGDAAEAIEPILLNRYC